MAEILGLRAERAQLLGFKTAADSALEFSMAKTPATVRKLLMEVWAPARVRAGEERDQLQEAARAEGGNFKLAAWDWRYYAEKVRKARFDVDDGEIKPYLQLDNVIAAAFDVAGKLFGIDHQGAQGPARLSPGRARLRGDAAGQATSGCSSATTSPDPPSTRAPGCRAGASRRSSPARFAPSSSTS